MKANTETVFKTVPPVFLLKDLTVRPLKDGKPAQPLSGTTSRILTSIQRYGNLLTGQQRLWLSFPQKKGNHIRKVPSWNALYNFLTQIDPKAFSGCLNTWLESLWEGFHVPLPSMESGFATVPACA
jgi:hypothetical protein